MQEHKYPILYSSPTEINLTPERSFEYRIKEFNDLEFIIPSKNIVSEKLSEKGFAKTFDFDDSKRIVVLEGIDYIASFDEYRNNIKFLSFFSKKELDSNAGFLKSLASVVPDEMSVFDSNAVLVGKFIKIEFKKMTFLADSAKELYYITTPNIEAFEPKQEGKSNNFVIIVNKKNDKTFSFIFSKNISQEEINLVLSSIR